MAFTEQGATIDDGSDVDSELFFNEEGVGVDELFQAVLKAAKESDMPMPQFIERVVCEISLGRGRFFEGQNISDEALLELFSRLTDHMHGSELVKPTMIGALALVNRAEKG